MTTGAIVKSYVVILAVHGIFLPACFGSEPKDEGVKGLYLRYEGAEYESAFVRCSSHDVWHVDGGKAFDELVKTYKSIKSSELSPYGELYIEAMGKFFPTDKKRFPDSHYAGNFRLVRLLSHSTDPGKTAACRPR